MKNWKTYEYLTETFVKMKKILSCLYIQGYHHTKITHCNRKTRPGTQDNLEAKADTFQVQHLLNEKQA